MLLGSILLALAWAALQGEITLANLVGYVFGYVILALWRRRRMPRPGVGTAHAVGCGSSSGNWCWPT